VTSGKLFSVNTNKGSTPLKITISCKLAVWLNAGLTVNEVSLTILLMYLISVLTATLVPTEIISKD